MKAKPEIHYTPETGFTKDNKPISCQQAGEIWDAATGNWTMRAFDQMRRICPPDNETEQAVASERSLGA